MSTAERFKHSMHLLSPRLGEEGRWVIVPGSVRSRPSSQRRALRYQRILKRRRRILIILGVLAGVSFISALLGGPGGWTLHLLLVVGLMGFAFFLVESRRRREEQSHQVRPPGPARQVRTARPARIAPRRPRVESEFEFFEPAMSDSR